MRLRPLFLLAALVPCAWFAAVPDGGAPAPAAGPRLQEPAVPAFEAARALLSEGKPDEARASAELELASRPYDADGYAVLLDVADAADDDAARLHWGKWLYWSQKYGGRSKQATETAARLANVYEGWNRDEAIVQSWSDSMLKAAKTAAGKKQYRLAGHLLSKLLALNPTDKTVQREWDAMVDKAGQEVSGGGFQAAEVRRKSASWIAKENAKHEDWESRWTEKTKYYEVETNLDYSFFVTVCAAMDQINEFYRDVHGYEKKVPKARVAILRKRTEFDRFTQELTGNAMPSEGVGGFWLLGNNTVVAYDRSYGNPNQTREDLWFTLFHEGSHQFMELLMLKSERKGLITPIWLFEGVGCYFEGTRINADGSIVMNEVAEHRLRSWWYQEHSADPNDKKDLRGLIGHERNLGADKLGTRSYEGEFYSYGWALTYFLLNYEENDRRVYGPSITPDSGEIPADYKAERKAGRLVYRDVFQDYLDYYAEEGNKLADRMQPFEKAVELFVDKVADPEIPDWDAFEKRWHKFTTSLYGEMQTAQEFADVLHARCRGYLAAEDWERARITAEQADAKRPNDPESFRLLAEANLGDGRAGEAVYWMFRHWELIWPTGDAEALAAAEKWLESHGAREIVSGVCATSKKAKEAAGLAMEEALAAGHPVLAALTASHLQQALGIVFEDLDRQAAELSELSRQELRMWQAAYNKGPLSNRKLQLSEGSRDLITAVDYQPDGLLMYDPPGPDGIGFERCDEGSLAWLAPPYDVRGRVQVDGSSGRVLLGLDRNGRPRMMISFEHSGEDESEVGLWTLDQRADAQSGQAFILPTQAGGLALDQRAKVFEFELTLNPGGGGTFAVNGESLRVPEKEFSLPRLTGGLALSVGDDTAAKFTGIEVRPNRPFWPVAPE